MGSYLNIKHFDNPGGFIAVSNAAGRLLSRTFDIDDRLTNAVDRNGVATSMTYDKLGRMLTRSYPDGGAEQFGYSAFGLMAYTNQLTNATHYGYDAAQRKIAETNALSQTNQFGYDPAGDLVSLADANSHTTQWGYDQFGRVTNKVDATSATILKYQYDADNRLTNRWSIAKGNTAYGYDKVGNLTGVTYPTNTPLSFVYDNINEMTSMSNGIGTITFTYTPGGQLASESGPWARDQVGYTYTNRLRIGLDLQQPSADDWVGSYAYDTAERMKSVASPAGTFNYTYNPGLVGTTCASSLIAKLTLPNGAWITNTYDSNGRMLGTWLYNSSASGLDSSVYTNNVGNQRVSLTRSGENTASYTYDAIGQVVADLASEGATSRLNEQLHYVFDKAGNLNYRTNNALVENFQVNNLNELTSNANSGTLTVVGTTSSAATNVTVNGSSAARYGDATFAAAGMPLTNSYTAVAQDSYGRRATNTVNVSIAGSTTFQYDGNGNLTSDGLRNFAYDDENQLIQVLVTNQWKSQFQYDAKMRRRIRQEFAWQNSAWVQTNAVYYVYDGNVVVQERDVNNLPTTTYTRGLDLSGSLRGAGGIGGLLARTSQAYAGAPLAGHSYYHSDGNGNVTILINDSQAIVAKYLYDAFGNILAKSGLLADANFYRFSSKESHPNSGLVYYLYRYYDPNLQRWPNRDPLGDFGNAPRSGFTPSSFGWIDEFENLSEFCRNNPVSITDHDGRFATGVEVCTAIVVCGIVEVTVACIIVKVCTKPKPNPTPSNPACSGPPRTGPCTNTGEHEDPNPDVPNKTCEYDCAEDGSGYKLFIPKGQPCPTNNVTFPINPNRL